MEQNEHLKAHPDFLPEMKRLDFTVDCVCKEIEKTEKKYQEFRRDTKAAFIEYSVDDSSMSYDEIALNASLFYAAQQKYRGLLKAQYKPYFCRVDFREENRSEFEKYYIGKTALIGENNELYIIDWRAPLASVYYDARLGNVSYLSPQGVTRGELSLKRQYIINDAELSDIMDIDITTNDEFLQQSLGENKDNRLKDIVSTIQAEQNAIIRADIFKPLVVQGVAGSGKTTIALHRIAYLIYTYEKSFTPENFLIIAPNKLFLNYISDVLPELGVERVRQRTFAELAYNLTEVCYKLTDSDEKITQLIEGKDNESIYRISQFKGSLLFRDIIDAYIADIEDNAVPMGDFTLDEYLICFRDEVKDMFINDYKYIGVFERLGVIKNVLKNKLKNRLPNIKKSIENEYFLKIKEAKNNLDAEEAHEAVIELKTLLDMKLKDLNNASKTAVRKYLAMFKPRSLEYYFEQLMTKEEILGRYYKDDENFAYGFCKYNNELIAKNKIEYEDLTILLYLKFKLFGFSEKQEIKNIVIDEAQDYSLFQLFTLKMIFKTEMFTVLGDISQGIHSYRGINDWKEVTDKVFTKGKCQYLTLEQSYRTTIEIMNYANKIISRLRLDTALAKPVVRHGDTPSLKRLSDKISLKSELESLIADNKNRGFNTTAIICKTDNECAKIWELIPEGHCLSSKGETYEGGITILPSYLSKGLEFDSVIIVALDEDYTENELDIKLLYVAMTRALHCLHILTINDNLRIIE